MKQHRSVIKTGMIAGPCMTFADMQAHSRMDGTTEQALMDDYLSAAESYVADLLDCSFLIQEWTARYTEFPLNYDRRLPNTGFLATSLFRRDGRLYLPKGPVVSDVVPTITYIDTDGVEQPLTDFQFDPYSTFAELAPAAGSSWPETLCGGLNNVKAIFQAGMAAAAADVDQKYKQVIRLLAAQWYEFRVPLMPGDLQSMGTPGGFDQMVLNLRRGS